MLFHTFTIDGAVPPSKHEPAANIGPTNPSQEPTGTQVPSLDPNKKGSYIICIRINTGSYCNPELELEYNNNNNNIIEILGYNIIFTVYIQLQCAMKLSMMILLS